MSTEQTPLMKQYFEIKARYQDATILFQVGDFYEVFFEDAKKVSAFLAIALTKRGRHKDEDIPLCGVPVHTINHYITKLVRGGFKVALCEQLTKPQPGKMVERAVTKVFTPGTLTDDHMLDNKSASYLLSFYPGQKSWGLLFTEVLTAQMFATTLPADSYRMSESELIRFFPDEVLVPADKRFQQYSTYFQRQGYVVSSVSEEDLDFDLWVERQFNKSITNYLNQFYEVKSSLKLLYSYFKTNQAQALNLFNSIQFYQPEDYLILDASTQKNLEIINNSQDGGKKNTLFSVVDRAATSMGSRTIKKWLQRPLVQKQSILQRQEVIAAFVKNVDAMQQLEILLGRLSDVERIVGRIALKRAIINDYLALKDSLRQVPKIKSVLQQYFLFFLTDLVQEKLHDFSALAEFLEHSLNTESGAKWIIKKGFDQELDRLRDLVEHSQQAVLSLEQGEIERTGINSLKIRYNNVAGYYIEITKPNLEKVPDNYEQQQTLVNRNRYVTQELKDLERDIVRAQNEIDLVEEMVFSRVKKEVEEQLPFLRKLSQALAYLDAIFGLAKAAYDNRYVVPKINDTGDIFIEKGRHPVVEQVAQFIPNNTSLTENESLWIVTGPNMGGKSTYLRQVALLSVMAQIGSFVPADSAFLPILDRIFTRIGSGDNLAQGKSTFLVEMEETAIICTQATKNSLVILDEVGRGTSTYDGMALAQAIIEHIVQNIGARCLFATHYHELTHLSEKFSSIANYHMRCQQSSGKILFLHEIAKGVAPGSFGIEVAKLADLPPSVIARASEVLRSFDSHFTIPGPPNGGQISALQLENINLRREISEKTRILDEINSVSLDELSPRQALELVWKIKEKQL